MNIEDVRSVFGAVAPAPEIAENKSNLLPIVLLVVVVGVGVALYINSTKYETTRVSQSKSNIA